MDLTRLQGGVVKDGERRSARGRVSAAAATAAAAGRELSHLILGSRHVILSSVAIFSVGGLDPPGFVFTFGASL